MTEITVGLYCRCMILLRDVIKLDLWMCKLFVNQSTACIKYWNYEFVLHMYQQYHSIFNVNYV